MHGGADFIPMFLVYNILICIFTIFVFRHCRHIFSEWVSQMNMTFPNESSTTAPPMNDVVDDTDIVNSAGTSMRSQRSIVYIQAPLSLLSSLPVT